MKISPTMRDLSDGLNELGVGNDETEAIAVHGEASRNQILVGRELWQSVAVRIDLNQFPGSDQLLKTGIELSTGLSMQTRVRGRTA